MAWEKGQSGNPGGRPKKGIVYDLERAIKKVEKSKGKKLLEHAAEQAFEDNTVLTAVLRKLLPDLKAVEATLKGEMLLIPMTPAERLAYEEAAEKLARGEVQKALTEGPDSDEDK